MTKKSPTRKKATKPNSKPAPAADGAAGKTPPAAEPNARQKIAQKAAEKLNQQKGDIVNRPAVEMMQCRLTEKEVNNYARAIAGLDQEQAIKEKKLKDYVQGEKSEIAALKTRRDEISRKIGNGHEDRQVRCFWQFDFKAGFKTLYRQDVDPAEEVRKLPILPEERQGRLPIGETMFDKVSQAADKMAKEPAGKAAEDKAGETKPGPEATATEAASDAAGTSEAASPAAPPAEGNNLKPGVESELERKVRIWWNSLDKDSHKKLVGEAPEAVAIAGVPYKRMTEAGRDLVRAAYKTTLESQQQPK